MAARATTRALDAVLFPRLRPARTVESRHEGVVMNAPSAAPPPPGMMRPLALDDHPTHPVRDHLVGAAALAAFCLLALLPLLLGRSS
ncbi:hypothetical protein PDTK01_10580 [Phycicoccus sp. DTK01]|nr:hypothetical protein PDTK01_10580 [Phycicoccus sp. DTK01]